jgi:hypothetical protein
MLHRIRAGDLAVDVVVYATSSLVTEFVRPFLRVREPAPFQSWLRTTGVRMLKH